MGLEVKIYDTPAGGIGASQGTFSSFGIIRSVESPLNEVLLNTNTGIKAVVLRDNKQYFLKEQVNLY